MRESKGERTFHFINYIVLILFSFICLYPMYYVVMASFSSSGALLAHSGLLLAPLNANTSAYDLVLNNRNIWTGYGNTLFIVGVGTVLSLLVSSSAAYALSRKGFKAGRPIMILITFTMMFSGGMIPLFIVVQSLGLYDTIWSLILPVLVNTTNMIILRTAFAGIPDSVLESADIDGANDLVIYVRIALPLIKASLAVICLYYCVSYWNSWFTASIYLRTRRLFPLQLVLREILIANDNESTDSELMSESIKYAAIVVSTLPILFAYPFLQKYFVKGVMIGAVKG